MYKKLMKEVVRHQIVPTAFCSILQATTSFHQNQLRSTLLSTSKAPISLHGLQIMYKGTIGSAPWLLVKGRDNRPPRSYSDCDVTS